MPIESATYIDGLNASNPVGSTDKVQTLDDHVRLIKSTIKATFPNVNGAVNFTPTVANYLVGVTSAIQTQLDGKAASSHAHSAADLTSGTIPDARFPATLPAASGVNLTALNGTNIASGTVADARLSSNVPLKNTANTFTNASQLVSASNATWGVADSAVAGQLLAASGDSAVYVGATSSHALTLLTNNVARMSISNAGAFDFKSGAVTTNNASPSEVGFKGVPFATDETPVLADAGKIIIASGNVTIPANASVAYPVGTVLSVYNATGGNITIAVTSDSLVFAGVGSSGSRTLASTGLATLIKVSSSAWVVSGAGLS